MWNLQRSLMFALVLAAVGCTSASIEASWRSPTAPHLSNVVTLSPAPDGAVRRSTEDKLAQELSLRGVRAVPAYTVLTDQDLNNRETMMAKLRAGGFDSIVSMRLVGAHQVLRYYPAFNDYWGGAWGYWGGWGGYGGTLIPETIIRVEVNAYSLDNGQLIWSAMSKSVDPASAWQVVSDVTKLVTDKLAQERLLGRPQEAMR